MSHTPNYNAKVKAILDDTTHGERVCRLTGDIDDSFMNEQTLEVYTDRELKRLLKTDKLSFKLRHWLDDALLCTSRKNG